MLEPYIKTFLWACTPLLELRASIPLGYLRYGLSIYESVMISVGGIVLTSILLIYLLPVIVRWGEKNWKFLHQVLQKIFEKTRAKHRHKISLLGEIALITFVIIPLPGSGAWSGVLIAYLFGIPPKKAVLLITTGLILSGILIALITLFGHSLWDIFFGSLPDEVLSPPLEGR